MSGRNQRRFALALLASALVAISIAGAFFLVRAMPGDPAELRLAATGGADEATRRDLQQKLGLDRSVAQQFKTWIAALGRGDLGRSLATDRPIAGELKARLPWSLAIGLLGLATGAFMGCLLAFAAAWRDGAASAASRVAAILGQSTPAFGLGLIVIWIFGVQLNWIRPFTGGPVERLLLPILVIALLLCGPVSRVALAAFEEAKRAPWFTAARAKGLTLGATLMRHAAPHAALAVLAGLAPELAWVVGGSAVTEVVFAVPGLGVWVVEAIGTRDYAVLQIYIALALVWLALTHGALALLRAWIDPRPRSAA